VSGTPTGLGPDDYLENLLVDPEQAIADVYALDGATLHKIGEIDHYVIITCTAHRHRGRELLERTFPEDWVCFHSAINTEDGIEYHHYGPDDQ
jgi:hypothetical protein